MYLISLSMAIAPAIFLVWYYYRQDKATPEPKGLIIKVFFLGVLSIIPAVILEIFVEKVFRFLFVFPLAYYFFKAFLVAGFCEEWIKLQVVKLFVYKRSEFDEIMDGIVYMVVASLGFACFENVVYVLQGGINRAILRAFTAIPLHALASGIMGFYIGKAKFSPDKHNYLIIKGLLIAALIHGFYDFVLFATPVLGNLPTLLIIPLLVFCFIFLRIRIKEAIDSDVKAGRTVL